MMHDTETVSMIASASTLAKHALVDPAKLWNSTSSFFRATDSGNQIFTDSLYGQMLFHHHFSGNFSIDREFLQQHLAYEWDQNQDQYGMRVLNNPVQEDSVWMK